ncbi:hypothetical protein [Chitinophaga sp.]|uniref:hypothetical protein n=1 Tax=Chitinophaga sp. TaxID=1869181 RepID=UPI0031E18163
MIPKSDDIANELQELIPGAQWPQQAPLSGVPAGYFESLPAIILGKVRQVDVMEELQSLSSMLAAVPKTFPLTLPQGYFEQLPQRIIARIQEPELTGISRNVPFSAPPKEYFEQLPQRIIALVNEELAPELTGISRKSPFTPPPNEYFGQLSLQVMQKIKMEEAATELAAISPLLATLPKAMPFSLPAGYFEQFPAQLLQQIQEAESVSPFAELTRATPFSMPAGYFEQLSAQVIQKVRNEEVADELADISPLLASLPKAMPFSVPNGYFDQLDTQVAAIAQAPAKVVNLRPRRMQFYKWAAAACMLALVGTSSLYYMRNTQHVENQAVINLAEASLSDVSDQEIVEYLQNHMDAFDKEDLMGLTAATPEVTTENTPLPGGLSTEDIESYLENTGSLKEESPIKN